MLPVPIKQSTRPAPERSESPVLKPRQRRHSQVELFVSLFFSPEQELDEQVLHHARRSAGRIPHEVYRHLSQIAARKQVCECDCFSFDSNNADRKSLDVTLVESSKR